MKKEVKVRDWKFIIYPDSCPNYLEVIKDMGFPTALSPLHDKDYKDDGEPDKPHFHAVISFRNSVTESYALRIADMFTLKKCLPCYSISTAVDYFTHKDYPEKAQYNVNDIQYLNGFELDLPKWTRKQIAIARNNLIRLIRSVYFKDFFEFIVYLQDNYNDKDELYLYFDIVTRYTSFFDKLIHYSFSHVDLNCFNE